MEHYVLCIWNGPFPDEEQILVANYLDSLFPSVNQLQYTFDFASEVAVLLNPVSKYIAVINTTKEFEITEWEVLEENINIKDILKERNHIDSKESIPTNVVEQLSTTIHTLADLLPAFGTYKLDVLIGCNILKDLSVSKEPLLCNAFFRLSMWHSAYFSVFIQQECDQDRLNEWCEIINAEILHSNRNLELGAVLWRGSVELQSCNNQGNFAFQGFELKFDLVENENTIFCHSLSKDTKQMYSEHIVLSSKMQVVDEISFQSIPPYILTPIAFRMHVGKPNILNENSSCFTDYLLSNKKVALIIRLEYAKMTEKLKPDKKYSTSRWQRAVSAGCFKSPECFVSKRSESYITFAVTKSRQSNHILAYPLRNTKNFNENFIFSIINYKSFNKSSHVSEETVDTMENILSKVPFIQPTDCHKILSKHVKLETISDQNGSPQSGIKVDSNFISLWEDVNNLSSTSTHIKTKARDFLFEDIDPSDWPERIQLLHKQMQNEEKLVPDNALLAQNLKLPLQSFSISSEDISQYFLPSGEPKNSANVEVLNPPNLDHFVPYDFNEILHMNWPEIMNCIYHDLYYNFSCQTEDKESLCSQMVKLYVQHETASSCNKQQIIQSFSITVPDKTSSPFKEFRSPSSRQTNFQRPRDYITTTENSMKDLLTKKMLFTPKSSQTSKKEEQSVSNGIYKKRKSSDTVRCNPRKKISVNYAVPVRSSPRKKIPVSYSGSVRCSPRKKTLINFSGPSRCSPRKKNSPNINSSIRSSPKQKNPVNHFHPNGSRNSNVSKNNSNSKSQMSELLRKKVRSAVATALENNGISLNHPFYQPCGSRLFSICQTFLQDLPLKKGKTSEYLQKIADAHVKQVIEFFKD